MIYIIIPTYNRIELLKPCLASLYRQLTEDFKVILVDNHSTDATLDFVQKNYPSIVLIRLITNKGFAAACNEGIKKALLNNKTAYIFILNNDTFLPCNFLYDFLEEVKKNKGFDMFTPKINFMDNESLVNSKGISITADGGAKDIDIYKEDNNLYEPKKEVFGPSGCAALYSKKLIEDVGGFDNDYFAYMEDVDLAWRARTAGYKCLYIPKAVLYHKGSGTTSMKSLFKLYYSQRNRFFNILKNYPDFIILNTIFNALKALIPLPGKLNRLKKQGNSYYVKYTASEQILVYLKVFLSVGVNIPSLLKKRRQVYTKDIQMSKKEVSFWLKNSFRDIDCYKLNE